MERGIRVSGLLYFEYLEVYTLIFTFHWQRFIHLSHLMSKEAGKYGNSPLSIRDTLKDPQWMPVVIGSPELYIYYFFSYTYIALHLKEHFTGSLWHSQIANITTLTLWDHC